MTLNNIASQLFDLTDGYIGTVRRADSAAAVAKGFAGTFEGGANAIFCILHLPDGDWYCKVSRFADGRDGFDYYLPETREAEASLINHYGLRKLMTRAVLR